MKNKKGIANNITVWVTVLFFAAMLLGVTLYVLAKFQSQIGSDLGNESRAYQAVDKTVSALATIPDWFTILVIAVMAGIIVAIISLFFALRRGGGAGA